MRKYLALAVVAAVIVGLAAWIFWPSKMTVKGGVVLSADSDSLLTLDDGECIGRGGYDDMSEGTQAVIRNSKGEKIAFGRLGPGEVDDEGYDICTFKFTIKDVPADEGFPYSIEVAHRGEISFGREDASAVVLTLGG
jgi:hypothetical protein